MIITDLHLHTKYSHGANTVQEMYTEAKNHGLMIIGFSEHSPRPLNFNYTHEYRKKLQESLPRYVEDVTTLRDTESHNGMQVLFGMEMDWLEGEEDFATKSAHAFDFDYLIGSVHFIGHWGFDDGREPWNKATQEECFEWYEAYFSAWEKMISSNLYNIAAHPDLIKIFSVERFHEWLAIEKNQKQVEHCLQILKETGMAMEISSAGLRKACSEIYPCREIMEMAASLRIPITFASDAHKVSEVAFGFEALEGYAKSYGYTEYVYFNHGKMLSVSF